jgi:hypothetical protein
MPSGPHHSSSRRREMFSRCSRSHRQDTFPWGAKGEISEFDSLLVVSNHVDGRRRVT